MSVKPVDSRTYLCKAQHNPASPLHEGIQYFHTFIKYRFNELEKNTSRTGKFDFDPSKGRFVPLAGKPISDEALRGKVLTHGVNEILRLAIPVLFQEVTPPAPDLQKTADGIYALLLKKIQKEDGGASLIKFLDKFEKGILLATDAKEEKRALGKQTAPNIGKEQKDAPAKTGGAEHEILFKAFQTKIELLNSKLALLEAEKKKSDAAGAENATLKREIDKLHADVEELKGKVKALNGELEIAGRKIRQRDVQMSALEEVIEVANEDLETARQEILRRDGLIYHLDMDIQQRVFVLANAQDEIETSRQEILRRDGLIYHLERDIQQRVYVLADAQDELERLNGDLVSERGKVAHTEQLYRVTINLYVEQKHLYVEQKQKAEQSEITSKNRWERGLELVREVDELKGKLTDQYAYVYQLQRERDRLLRIKHLYEFTDLYKRAIAHWEGEASDSSNAQIAWALLPITGWILSHDAGVDKERQLRNVRHLKAALKTLKEDFKKYPILDVVEIFRMANRDHGVGHVFTYKT